jgi:hypothetical protein
VKSGNPRTIGGVACAVPAGAAKSGNAATNPDSMRTENIDFKYFIEEIFRLPLLANTTAAMMIDLLLELIDEKIEPQWAMLYRQ